MTVKGRLKTIGRGLWNRGCNGLWKCLVRVYVHYRKKRKKEKKNQRPFTLWMSLHLKTLWRKCCKSANMEEKMVADESNWPVNKLSCRGGLESQSISSQIKEGMTQREVPTDVELSSLNRTLTKEVMFDIRSWLATSRRVVNWIQNRVLQLWENHSWFHFGNLIVLAKLLLQLLLWENYTMFRIYVYSLSQQVSLTGYIYICIFSLTYGEFHSENSLNMREKIHIPET